MGKSCKLPNVGGLMSPNLEVESKLNKDLLKLFPDAVNEFGASSIYDELRDQEFIDFFGQWFPTGNKKVDNAAKKFYEIHGFGNNNILNEQGEPRLTTFGNESYFTNSKGERWIINPRFLSQKDKMEVANALGFGYLKSDKTISVRRYVNDKLVEIEASMNKESLDISKKLITESKTLSFADKLNFMNRQAELSKRIKAIRSDILNNPKIYESIVGSVQAMIDSRGAKYPEDVEAKEEDEDVREDGSGVVPTKDSTEVMDSANIDKEIKALLMSVPEYVADEEGVESPKVSELLGMPLMRNGNIVKNRIMENVSNIVEIELSTNLADGTISDPYDLMINKLKERALENEDSLIRDFVSLVEETFNSKSSTDKEAFKTKFVTAFYKSSNVFTITELTEGEDKLIIRHIDPASTQDKEAFVSNDIARTILNKFAFSGGQMKNKKDYEQAKEYLTDIRTKNDLIKGLKYLGLELNNKAINQLYRNRANVYKGVRPIGSMTLEEMFTNVFNQEIAYTNKDKEIEKAAGLSKTLDTYYSSDGTVQKEILGNLIDKQVYSPLYVLSAYEARFKEELNDSTMFVGSKQRWTLSLISGMNKEILKWKAGNLKSLYNKKHKGLQYVHYLLAMDIVERGAVIENSDEHKQAIKDRIAGLNIIINSEIKKPGDNSPTLHKEVGEADLHMDVFFKMFNRNDEIYDKLEQRTSLDKAMALAKATRDIVPNSYSADKSSFYSLKGLGSMEGSVEIGKDGNPKSIGVRNKELLRRYLFGEYNTMLAQSKLIQGYTDLSDPLEKQKYLMKYLIPDYHYNTKDIDITQPLTADRINKGTWNKFGFFNSAISTPEGQKVFKMLFVEQNGVKYVQDEMDSHIADLVPIVEGDLIEIMSSDLEAFKNIKLTDKKSLFEVNTNIKDSASTKTACDYIINSIFNNIEIFSIFNGDLAFYKQSGNELSMVDALKRGPAVLTDGLYFRKSAKYNEGTYTDFFGEQVKYNKENDCIIAILDVLENDKSKHAKEISKALGKNVDYEHEIADAGGYITLDFYKEAISRIYGWEEIDQKRYDNLNDHSYKPTKDDIAWLKNAGRTMQSIKFTGFGLEEITDPEGTVIGEFPVYLKYSAAVLAPAIIGGTELEKLNNTMKKQGVNQVLFKSGSKASNRQATTIYNKEDGIFTGLKEDMVLNPFKFNLSNLKLQVELPTKFDKDGVVGSQHLKNLIANLSRDADGELNDTDLDYEFRGERYTAKGVFDLYDSTIKNILQNQLNKFSKMINLQEDINGYKFDETLFRDLIIDQLDAVTDEDLIEIVSDESLPLEAVPGLAQRLFPVIAGTIHKKVGKLRTNSASAIQVANIGYDMVSDEDKNQIIYLSEDKELRPPLPKTYKDLTIEEKSNIRGEAKPDDIVYINEEGFYSTNPEDGKMVIKKARIMLPFTSIYKETGMSYEELNKLIQSGKVDMNIFSNIIGYRIPNQAISSNDSIEIVGILPPSMGDTAIVYHEITKKTGSDFDIDKMYLMMPNFKVIRTGSKTTAYKILDEMTQGNFRERMAKLRQLNKDITENDLDLNISEKGARSELIDAIMSSDNTENEIVKRIKAEAKNLVKVEGLKYNDSNDDKGMQNKLIEVMSSILTSHKTYDDLMSPLDAEYGPKQMIHEVLYLKSIREQDDYKKLKKEFEDFTTEQKIAKLKEFAATKKLTTLQQLSPANMIKARVDMLKAKKLVASMANHMTDVPMSQIINQVFKYDLGIDTNDFGREFIKGQEGNSEAKMTKLISYLMNAAVDAAKDNYIIEGNFNSYTVGGAMAMIRMGVDPINVFKVLLNDDILELSNIKQLQAQKMTNIKGEAYTQDEMNGYSEKFVNYIQDKKIVNFNDFIEEGDMDADLILGFWNIMTLVGKELNNEIATAKPDSNGPGKNIYEHHSYFNRLERLMKDNIGSDVNGNFVRGKKLFKTGITKDKMQFSMDISSENTPFTFFGAMMNNSLLLTNMVTRNMFTEATDDYRQMVNRISNQFGVPLPIDSDNIKLISNYIYPFIMSQSGHVAYNINEERVKYLQTDFLNEFSEKKRLNPDNEFLKNLYIDAVTGLITFPNYKYFGPVERTIIREAAEDLYKQTGTNNELVGLEFMNSLVQYAFLTTGFKPTYFAMNEMLPKSYFLNTGHGAKIKALMNTLNSSSKYTTDEYINKAITFIGINNETNFKFVKDLKSLRGSLPTDTAITDRKLISQLKIKGTDNFYPFLRKVRTVKIDGEPTLVSELYMLVRIDEQDIEKNGTKIKYKTPVYTEVVSNTSESSYEANKNLKKRVKVKLFDMNTLRNENLFVDKIYQNGMYMQPELEYISPISMLFGGKNLMVTKDDLSLQQIEDISPTEKQGERKEITPEILENINKAFKAQGFPTKTMEEFLEMSEEDQDKNIECYG